MRQEKRDEKRLNKERKLEQRRLELEIARELKKPNEDMCLSDHKVVEIVAHPVSAVNVKLITKKIEGFNPYTLCYKRGVILPCLNAAKYVTYHPTACFLVLLLLLLLLSLCTIIIIIMYYYYYHYYYY